MICLRCDSEQFTEAERNVPQEYHGDSFTVTTLVMVCDACGWFTATTKQADELGLRTIAKYEARCKQTLSIPADDKIQTPPSLP